MSHAVQIAAQPTKAFRSGNGRRRAFATAAEARAYEHAFDEFPAVPNDFDEASAAGFYDAEQQYQDACNRFGVAA